MKRIVLLALLLVLLSGCAAKPTDVVYYVLGDGLYRTDGENTERVYQAADLGNRIAQVGDKVYFYRYAEEYLYCVYTGRETIPFHTSGVGPLPTIPLTKRLTASEAGAFLDGEPVQQISEKEWKALPAEVETDIIFVPDADDDWFYGLSSAEGENGTWHLWYWQADLDTDEVQRIDLNQIIPEGHHGRAWADNGTIWIEHSTTEMATACIQQWDPQTGTLLAELPRYHDGYYIVHMEVHDGMLFFIDRCELWVRLPNGTLHELMELPEGPLYDYENFPPAMYYGESAMVVVIDGAATYIAYPQNKS